MPNTLIVIPCYNEGLRFPTEAFERFFSDISDVQFLFVNDGSRDNTLEVLHALESRWPKRCVVHSLAKNVGKAEAVRQGCVAAFERGADQVGYWDADLATPLDAIPAFLKVLRDRPHIELVCGSRVQMMGRDIRRSSLRHYGGRVFATVASLALGLKIYDTQCGAKVFRASPRMRFAFSEPFQTRWLIDVEILARVLAVTRNTALPPVPQIVYELPLEQWQDLAGSKVKPLDFPKAFIHLSRIYWRYLRAAAHPLTLPKSSDQIIDLNRDKARAA